MPSEWKEEKLKYKYAELPEEPKYVKKKKKVSVKKSNHKHIYEPCLLKYNKDMYGATYCIKCGRIDDIFFRANVITNDKIPTFDVTERGLFTKKVDLPGTSSS